MSATSSEPQKSAQEEGGSCWCWPGSAACSGNTGTGAGEAREEQEVLGCPAAALWVLPGRQGKVRMSLPAEAPLKELSPGTDRTQPQVKIKSCSLESQRDLKGNLALILQSTCCSALPACAGGQSCRYTGLGRGNQKKRQKIWNYHVLPAQKFSLWGLSLRRAARQKSETTAVLQTVARHTGIYKYHQETQSSHCSHRPGNSL